MGLSRLQMSSRGVPGPHGPQRIPSAGLLGLALGPACPSLARLDATLTLVSVSSPVLAWGVFPVSSERHHFCGGLSVAVTLVFLVFTMGTSLISDLQSCRKPKLPSFLCSSALAIQLTFSIFCNLDFSFPSVYNLWICTIQNTRSVSLSVAGLKILSDGERSLPLSV